jgi:hypothetical protein
MKINKNFIFSVIDEMVVPSYYQIIIESTPFSGGVLSVFYLTTLL